MESGLQFWRMRRAVLAHSTTQTKQQFDEIFAESKLPLIKRIVYKARPTIMLFNKESTYMLIQKCFVKRF